MGTVLTSLRPGGCSGPMPPCPGLWRGTGPAPPADWNHCRRAVSRFLSVQLGDHFHSLRRAILKGMPIRAEAERVADLEVATFWRAVEAAP
jgi:hypothetical protein